jgi:excisionase family DNA binding protein
VSEARFLTCEEVAERLRCSVRSVHELTRTNSVPFRRLPGQRRCLFVEAELVAWEDGARLEVVELEHGGRVVKPVQERSLRVAGRRRPA